MPTGSVQSESAFVHISGLRVLKDSETKMTSASAVNDLGSDPAMTSAQFMCLCDVGNSVHKRYSTKCLVHLCQGSPTLRNQSITILHLKIFL